MVLALNGRRGRRKWYSKLLAMRNKAVALPTLPITSSIPRIH